MKLSSRSRYGFRAILELAIEYGNGPLQIKTIAEREGISNKYLEQLVAMLKSAGLVRSVRGPRGGYMLSKPPSDIRLDELFITLEGPLVDVECIEDHDYCDRCADCTTRILWQELQEAMMSVLNSKTLQDMVEMTVSKRASGNYHI